MAKLTQYALNPEGDVNKSRAFKKALGYDLSNASDLVENIRQHINEVTIVKKSGKGYGDIFEIAMNLKGPNGKIASVLTGWIRDNRTQEVRMTTIYVDKRKKGDGDNGGEGI